jgi:two-component system OmpR family sensor kinase
LTSIRGYAELMRRRPNLRSGEVVTAVRRIEDESVRMTALVDDLLLLARLDQGRPLEQEPVDLSSILRDAGADAAVTAPERTVTVDAPEAVLVRGDDLRLRQAVGNLVRNAVVHTASNTPIELSLARHNGQARLTVVDHGAGLGDEERSRVFEPFYRADPGRSRDKGGAGLGLSIVKAVVGAHGGQVEALETEGGGATFQIELPTLAG